MLTINIKTRPLTFNNAYPTARHGRRYLSAKGMEFKRQVLIHARQAMLHHGFKHTEGHYYSLEFHFYIRDLFNADGSLKKTKPDTDGCIKLAQDAIFEALGVDDYLALDYEQITMNEGQDSIVVILRSHPISRKKL